ncbi:hypothetical protein RP726_02785 [Candidatus Methylospira mobilis]|uniref:hypothetical protein n=1 Tax=Candidatus Methylospira mobilis TaxID=1808979 RepID=UPI0028E7178B|nr:hypothetical protein [Candidatus Methylospira mobilis]WNV05347.1 hypothetical protein RP726_02785 [Candidatus Methylospira mobilis]
MIEFTSRKSASSMLVCLFLLLSGLYCSLMVVIGSFGMDADSSHSLMLWYGINEHGISWIRDWRFTQDNWLLSLFPFHFIGFWIFGPDVSVVVILGWLIFVFNALISGAIAWRLGLNKAAIFIFLLLLHFGPYAHIYGSLAYSTTHNITNLYGLSSLLIFISWCIKPVNYLLVLLSFVLFAGAVSDPWMIPAFNLPLLLVSILLFFLPGFQRDWNRIKPFLAASLSLLLVKTKLFGILGFLPSVDFSPGDRHTINNNVLYLVKDLGGLLNLFPFSYGNAFLPAFLSLAIVTGFFAAFLHGKMRHRLGVEKSVIVFFSFTLVSISGILSAFMVTRVEAGDYSARFLINCAYLLIISVGMLAEYGSRHSGVIAKYALVLIAGLFVISGLTGNVAYLIKTGFKPRDVGVADTLALLKKHGLSYGYGSYWDSHANAVTAAGFSQIRVRPVTFDITNGTISGGRSQTSRRWFTDEDIPENQERFFVIVNTGGQECPDVDVCLLGLSKQFGNPMEIIKHGLTTVLVWNHRLFDYVPPSMEFNRKYITGNAGLHMGNSGWSSPETQGTWSDGDRALMVLAPLNPSKNDIELLIEAGAYLEDRHPCQDVDILVNSAYAATLKYDQGNNNGVRSVVIPSTLALKRGGALWVEFLFKNPVSPAELGVSADSRRLGLRIVSVELRDAPH